MGDPYKVGGCLAQSDAGTGSWDQMESHPRTAYIIYFVWTLHAWESVQVYACTPYSSLTKLNQLTRMIHACMRYMHACDMHNYFPHCINIPVETSMIKRVILTKSLQIRAQRI